METARMKLIALFAVLAVVIAVCEALPAQDMAKLSLIQRARHARDTFMVTLKKANHNLLSPRDPSDCENDLTEFFNSECAALAGEIESSDLPEYEIAEFCDNDCAKKILALYSKLVQDCGYAPIDPYEAELLEQSCDHGPKNEYCIFIWDDKFNDNPLPSSYENCVQDFPFSTGCPQSCKDAEDWIEKNVGCCYRALEDYLIYYDYEYGYYIYGYYWTSCGQKEPTLCVN